MATSATTTSEDIVGRMVLHCLICRQDQTGALQFLLRAKNGSLTFPPTKLRPREDLYHALVRPMQEDLGLPPGSYFAEQELEMLPSAGTSHRYPGLPRKWQIYPVWISLTSEGWQHVNGMTGGGISWMTLDEITSSISEPNVQTIGRMLEKQPEEAKRMASAMPSMDALACAWVSAHDEGTRVVRGQDVCRILDAGDRAFNLRVADPYLPYQKQGLGFTWSFFTPKDKQDIHVHGLPAVEIYGVLRGRMQLWYKSMNQRGVRMWQCRILESGDWAEVEPLNCHFVCWLDPDGLGTVVKAAGAGPLAGVGRIGVAGKTSCRWKDASGKSQFCSSLSVCRIPKPLLLLAEEFQKEHANRDYSMIAVVAQTANDTME